MTELTRVGGFDRDPGNARKSADKHGVSRSEAEQMFCNLLERIKVAANKPDVPYQSLIKVWLSEKLDPI